MELLIQFSKGERSLVREVESLCRLEEKHFYILKMFLLSLVVYLKCSAGTIVWLCVDVKVNRIKESGDSFYFFDKEKDRFICKR